MLNLPNPSFIIIVMGIVLLFIVALLLISIIRRTRIQKLDEQEELLDQLEFAIMAKEKELTKLNEQITNRTIDKSVSLSKVEIDVLDVYDKANIRIPADIIEDLSIQRLSTHQEVFDYIENQRNYWKLENSKKPYKGVITK